MLLCIPNDNPFFRGNYMPKLKNKITVKHYYLQTIGAVCVLLFALLLLWHGNATSNQAMNALSAQIYFDGEYRIADGEWQKIVKGEHISSMEGDVTLRGNFHMLAPDGEYVGLYSGDLPLFHFDLYRIDSYDDLYAIGFFDYLDRVVDVSDHFGKIICGFASAENHNAFCLLSFDSEYSKKFKYLAWRCCYSYFVIVF